MILDIEQVVSIVKEQGQEAADLAAELKLSGESDPVRLEALAGQIVAKNQKIYELLTESDGEKGGDYPDPPSDEENSGATDSGDQAPAPSTPAPEPLSVVAPDGTGSGLSADGLAVERNSEADILPEGTTSDASFNAGLPSSSGMPSGDAAGVATPVSELPVAAIDLQSAVAPDAATDIVPVNSNAGPTAASENAPTKFASGNGTADVLSEDAASNNQHFEQTDEQKQAVADAEADSASVTDDQHTRPGEDHVPFVTLDPNVSSEDIRKPNEADGVVLPTSEPEATTRSSNEGFIEQESVVDAEVANTYNAPQTLAQPQDAPTTDNTEGETPEQQDHAQTNGTTGE